MLQGQSDREINQASQQQDYQVYLGPYKDRAFAWRDLNSKFAVGGGVKRDKHKGQQGPKKLKPGADAKESGRR